MTQTSTSPSKTWLVTGASRGFGRAFVRAALERGDRVAATVRKPSALEELTAAHPEALVPLVADVGDAAAVRKVCTEVRAVRVQYVNVAVLPPEGDQVLAEIAQRLDLPHREVGAPPDLEPTGRTHTQSGAHRIPTPQNVSLEFKSSSGADRTVKRTDSPT